MACSSRRRRSSSVRIAFTRRRALRRGFSRPLSFWWTGASQLLKTVGAAVGAWVIAHHADGVAQALADAQHPVLVPAARRGDTFGRRYGAAVDVVPATTVDRERVVEDLPPRSRRTR